MAPGSLIEHTFCGLLHHLLAHAKLATANKRLGVGVEASIPSRCVAVGLYRFVAGQVSSNKLAAGGCLALYHKLLHERGESLHVGVDRLTCPRAELSAPTVHANMRGRRSWFGEYQLSPRGRSPGPYCRWRMTVYSRFGGPMVGCHSFSSYRDTLAASAAVPETPHVPEDVPAREPF